MFTVLTKILGCSITQKGILVITCILIVIFSCILIKHILFSRIFVFCIDCIERLVKLFQLNNLFFFLVFFPNISCFQKKTEKFLNFFVKCFFVYLNRRAVDYGKNVFFKKHFNFVFAYFCE